MSGLRLQLGCVLVAIRSSLVSAIDQVLVGADVLELFDGRVVGYDAEGLEGLLLLIVLMMICVIKVWSRRSLPVMGFKKAEVGR